MAQEGYGRMERYGTKQLKVQNLCDNQTFLQYHWILCMR